MIVISGVLLLVAVVFLIIGLFSSLAWVYASIGVSVLSFIFLLVGVRQRRGVPALPATGGGATALPPPPVAAGAGSDADVTVVTPRAETAPVEAKAAKAAAASRTAAGDAAAGATSAAAPAKK